MLANIAKEKYAYKLAICTLSFFSFPHDPQQTIQVMLANKSFRRLFVIAAAASMVLAFVRAAPTGIFIFVQAPSYVEYLV